MGIYPATCLICKKSFVWFSSNICVCPDCLKDANIEVRCVEYSGTPDMVKAFTNSLPIRNDDAE